MVRTIIFVHDFAAFLHLGRKFEMWPVMRRRVLEDTQVCTIRDAVHDAFLTDAADMRQMANVEQISFILCVKEAGLLSVVHDKTMMHIMALVFEELL
jgi:hypothetical protein